MTKPTAFQVANALLRKGEYSKSLEIYRDLMMARSDFPFYAANAALCARKLGESMRAACLDLQAYLSNRQVIDRLVRAASARGGEATTGDLVLVIVPAFNAEETIVEAIESILRQTHRNIKIIAVDDASKDQTYRKLLELERKDIRLSVLRSSQNSGPFFSVNLALFLARGLGFDYFIKHDADDVMLPEKIKIQLDALRKNANAYFCTTGYDRVDRISKKNVNGKERGHNMTLYRAKVFWKLGYFDSVRYGGDSEFLDRAIAAFGGAAEIHVKGRLTKAYFSPEGLTAINPLGSPERQDYQRKYRAEHVIMREKDFFWKSFNDHGKYIRALRQKRPVVCGVATLVDRKDALRETVESILPQVDQLIVYQNGYKEIFDFLESDKICVISSLDTGVDMGDAGKFYRVGDFKDVYYFSIDDDLVYPPNYVDCLLDVLAQHNDRVIACAHGRLCKPKVNSYYDDKIEVLHFQKEVDRLTECHFGGTGVMAFSTGHVNVAFSIFKHPNMADVWMGLHAVTHNIPVLVAPHCANWIRQSDRFDVGTTIFRQSRAHGTAEIVNDAVRGIDFSTVLTISPVTGAVRKDKLIVAADGSYFPSRSRKIVVAIPTFNRKNFLLRLVRQLDDAAKNFDVHLAIFDDGSEEAITVDLFDFAYLHGIEVHRFLNHGKKRYWSLVNKIFHRLSDLDADYYFYLADDLEIENNFFFDAMASWQSILDDKKISLNLLKDSRTQCWTGFEREEVRFGDFSVFKTQWLDMVMMFDRSLLANRIQEIPLSRWENKPLLSSGVGAQLSTRLHQSGYSMYQVFSSLVHHGDHVSEMNPEERKQNPLVALD